MPPNKRITYEQQTQMGLVAKRGHRSAAELGMTPAKPPARPAVITRIDPPARAEPDRQPIQQRSGRPTVSGSHTDKAKAFSITVIPLCFGLGLTSALWGVSMAFYGFISMWFVVVMLGIFSVSTAAMYLIDRLISPDGFPILSEYWRHRRLMDEQSRLYDILERDYND